MIEAIFRNMKEENEFMERLDSFKVKREGHYILDEIKKEAFMSDPQIVGLFN